MNYIFIDIIILRDSIRTRIRIEVKKPKREREREKISHLRLKSPSHQKIQRDPRSTLSTLLSKLVSTQPIPKITRSTQKKQDINVPLSFSNDKSIPSSCLSLPTSLPIRPKILAPISNRVTLPLTSQANAEPSVYTRRVLLSR